MNPHVAHVLYVAFISYVFFFLHLCHYFSSVLFDTLHLISVSFTPAFTPVVLHCTLSRSTICATKSARHSAEYIYTRQHCQLLTAFIESPAECCNNWAGLCPFKVLPRQMQGDALRKWMLEFGKQCLKRPRCWRITIIIDAGPFPNKLSAKTLTGAFLRQRRRALDHALL